MHEFASFNHQIKTISDIYIPAVSSAVFYGQSIFTTVAVYRAKPFQWEKHWRRLNENAVRVGIDLSDFTKGEVENSANTLISKNKLQNGRVRLTFFDESANEIWSPAAKNKSSLLVTTADFRAVPDNFRLTVSPFQVNSKSPLAGVKSGNYLENILALKEAARRGFDEAIRLNEKGETVSAAMANLFWVRREIIFTPPLETGAVRGTTREFVIKNFQVVEQTATLEELKNAAEIFITSAGIGITKVGKLENKSFENVTVSNN
ncbi:MAG: aminotransferase class IV, partial [Pyrinomonadaceae bacterium]